MPPQLTHTLAAHTLNAAVHSTSAPQHACPIPPHVPHEPLAPQVPSDMLPVPVHAPFAATHAPRTQHPPLQLSPSQHGWVAAPHASHLRVASQTTPLAVQNSCPPIPPPAVTQHASPEPPQAVAPVPQPLAAHVPRVPPQVVPAFTHEPATQHAPVPVHVCSGQHGWADPPHAVVLVPLSQIVPVPVDSPDPTHALATQQPPPVQAVPVAQQPSPGAPQTVTAHCGVAVSPAPHLPPFEHVAPEPTHAFVPGSQQSPVAVQDAPAQHVSPVVPQSTQRPAALHARPAPVHVSPAQHG